MKLGEYRRPSKESQIVRDGIIYVLVPGTLAVVLIILGLWPVALVFVVLAAFMAFFFRDPRRQPPTGADLVVSLDSSCLMQLQGAIRRAGHPIRTMHLAEVLACR